MKLTLAFLFLVVPGLLTLPAQTLAPELLGPENRTVSSSRLFTVFGGTRQERSELARRAERLREGLVRELGQAPAARLPIMLVLTPGEAMRLRQSRVFLQVFDAGESGRRIEINIGPGATADRPLIDSAILRALLLEWSLQNQQFAGDRFVEPPGWLVAAMTAAVGREEAVAGGALYAALLEGRGMPRLDRFLRQNAETQRGRARELYAAQSFALYRALSEMPGGRNRVVENLTLSEPSRDPAGRFDQTWPELLADPERAARLWALAVARLAAPERMEFFSAEESSRRLGALLESLQTSEPGEEPAGTLLELTRTAEGRFQLEQAAAGLRQLGFRSHPLYNALIEEYRVMLDGLARRKRRGFTAKFEEVEDVRLALDIRSREITDYLNWYQANAPDTHPTVRVGRISSSEPETRRNDAVSRYLDSVEQRGW